MTAMEHWLIRHRSKLVHAARMTAASVVAFVAAHALGLPGELWAVITALVVSQSSVGGSLKVAFEQFVGSLFGAVYGAAVALAIARMIRSPARPPWLSLSPHSRSWPHSPSAFASRRSQPPLCSSWAMLMWKEVPSDWQPTASWRSAWDAGLASWFPFSWCRPERHARSSRRPLRWPTSWPRSSRRWRRAATRGKPNSAPWP